MKNLIGRVKDGIGKGVAAGLLGLTLGMGVPMAVQGDSLRDLERISRKLIEIGNEITDQADQYQQEQQYQEQQKEQAQAQTQYQAEQEKQQQDEQAMAQARYQEQQQELAQLPQNQRHFFTCTGLSGAGNQYPQDYVGIKKVFKLNENESLDLVDYDPLDKAGDRWELDIYAPNGDLLYKAPEMIIPHDGYSMKTGDESDKTIKYLFEKAGGWGKDNPEKAFGEYKAVWFLNDAEIGETDFTITP